MDRNDIDALAEQWINGNRAHVIEALAALDGIFAARAAAYLYHEMPDDYNRGVFARMMQARGERPMSPPKGDTFIVLCREDRTPEGNPGRFVLATRRIFTNETSAETYARTVNPSREPMVIPGDFARLRTQEKGNAK